MGRRAEYTEPPKKPRIAKVAWEYFFKKYGPPKLLYFDDADGYWVGRYDPPQTQQEGNALVRKVPRGNIEGTGERRLVR